MVFIQKMSLTFYFNDIMERKLSSVAFAANLFDCVKLNKIQCKLTTIFMRCDNYFDRKLLALVSHVYM